MDKIYCKLSELTNDQQMHMAWRADRYTGSGLLTIGRLIRGEFGDVSVKDAFMQLDMTEHQAKWHARKVINYDYNTYKPLKS